MKRITDANFLRLIHRFLKGSTIRANGVVEKESCGTPQGGLMSPILANIYLDEGLGQVVHGEL